MKKTFLLFCIFMLIGASVYTDDLVSSLLDEFEAAGIDLRLDRDEVLHAELKIFDGFIDDPERAFFCGIKTVTGEHIEKGAIVFFNIQPNGELRQVYHGHVVLKRRYKPFDPENQSDWRTLLTAEERIAGLKLCMKKEEGTVPKTAK